jgi:hypothetical protein
MTTSWETALKAKPSNECVYIPCLKFIITAGSFVLYERKVEGSEVPKMYVGRVLQAVNNIDMVPEGDRSPGIQDKAILQEGDCGNSSTNNNHIPLQYIKINVFEEEDFSTNNGDDSGAAAGWKYLVQTEDYEWILVDSVRNLSFVFPAEEVILQHRYDDCCGMSNFFVLKHRCSQDGSVSSIPIMACPPFGGQLEGFDKYWSVDTCQVIFHGIREIGRAIQRVLCRIAQSQGDFASCNAKLQLPSCSWVYIKTQFERKGIVNVRSVAYSQPRPILSWGLAYKCIRDSGKMEVLRFDTGIKIKAFRQVFGCISGYGVRKKRPRYKEGQSLLNLNDVINVVSFPPDEVLDANHGDDTSTSPFQWFSVMEEGIDLLYNANDGILHVVVRYRKVVVTNESIPYLSDVGVTLHESRWDQDGNGVITTADILTGMDFMDGEYLMRVISVGANVIHARQMYRRVGNRSVSVNGNHEVVEYLNIADIHQRIQEMLEY